MINDNPRGYEVEDTIDDYSILSLIMDRKIEKINTCYIAKVIDIAENKVSVIPANKYMLRGEEIPPAVVNNCMLALPYSGLFKMKIPIQKGDFGLCIVCQDDTSNFKARGEEAPPNSDRRFDICDSIFLPAALYNAADLDEDLVLEYKDEATITFNKESLSIAYKENEVKLTSDGVIINAKSDPLEIKNANGSLLTALEKIVSMLDLIASGMKGSGTEPSAYKGGKDALMQQIKAIVK